MMLKILDWDRHKNVLGLNWLIVFFTPKRKSNWYPYMYCRSEIQSSRGEGWDPINQFNPCRKMVQYWVSQEPSLMIKTYCWKNVIFLFLLLVKDNLQKKMLTKSKQRV
jgi:hypothetical protein